MLRQSFWYNYTMREQSKNDLYAQVNFSPYCYPAKTHLDPFHKYYTQYIRL